MHPALRVIAILSITIAILLAAAWPSTKGTGARVLENYVLVEMKAPSNSTRVKLRSDLLELGQSLYCNAEAVAPLLIRLEFGHSCGALCGHGRTEYFLWSIWGHLRIYATDEWAS